MSDPWSLLLKFSEPNAVCEYSHPPLIYRWGMEKVIHFDFYPALPRLVVRESFEWAGTLGHCYGCPSTLGVLAHLPSQRVFYGKGYQRSSSSVAFKPGSTGVCGELSRATSRGRRKLNGQGSEPLSLLFPLIQNIISL